MVDVEKLRALLAAATPGPWKVHDEMAHDDMALSVAARNALPELLDEVERARTAALNGATVGVCSCVPRFGAADCPDCGGTGAVMVEGPK